MTTWKNVNGIIWWAQPGDDHRFIELYWDLAQEHPPILRCLAGHKGAKDKTIPMPKNWIFI